MAVVKVIEVMSSSKVSWEDATKQAIERASKSLKTLDPLGFRTKV